MMIDEQAFANIMRRGASGPADPRELRELAEKIDTLTAAVHAGTPEQARVASYALAYYSTAEHLRLLAAKLETDGTELAHLRATNDQLDLENGTLTGELERARIDRNSAVEAFFQASVKLQREQQHTARLHSFLVEALEELESGTAEELDIEVDFVFVAAGQGGGISPDLYSDVALAFADLHGMG